MLLVKKTLKVHTKKAIACQENKSGKLLQKFLSFFFSAKNISTLDFMSTGRLTESSTISLTNDALNKWAPELIHTPANFQEFQRVRLLVVPKFTGFFRDILCTRSFQKKIKSKTFFFKYRDVVS